MKMYIWTNGQFLIGSAAGIGESEQEAQNNIKEWIRLEPFSDAIKNMFYNELKIMFQSSPQIIKGAVFYSEHIEELEKLFRGK